MDPLIVLMMKILRDYCLEVHWGLPMKNRLYLMKESNCDLMMVKCLEPYLEMYMESHLGLILEQIWVSLMCPLMIVMMTSLRDY